MSVRTGDALTCWADEHRAVAGALFGMATALVVSVPMAIAGVPWSAILLAAVTAGLFMGLVVGLADRKINTYGPAAAARTGTKQPYRSLPDGAMKGRLPDDVSRRDKAIIFLGCMGLSVFIVVAGLVLHAKQLSYPWLAAWLILLEGTALWFWVTRDRGG